MSVPVIERDDNIDRAREQLLALYKMYFEDHFFNVTLNYDQRGLGATSMGAAILKDIDRLEDVLTLLDPDWGPELLEDVKDTAHAQCTLERERLSQIFLEEVDDFMKKCRDINVRR